MLTEDEKALCDARPTALDYDRIAGLHFVGAYTRELPVSLERMMENAYDWEHLPHVHASSFASIEAISSGPWGWRAKVGLPKDAGGGRQVLELLVDRPRHYWATTVLSGSGQGFEIHTQARQVSDGAIEVDVRFYLPEAPATPDASAAILGILTAQYKTLYDEDLGLMSGRQAALDDKARWRNAPHDSAEVRIGALDTLDPETVHTVETATGRYCVRRWRGRWIAHSAVCTHLLGPLDDSDMDEAGHIRCPWHGYRFDVETGENLDGKCAALASPPTLIERDGALYLAAPDA